MLDLPSINAAGGLVLNRRKQILFIYKDGRWDLPKGFIEGDTPAHETARDEVSEETGLPKPQLHVTTELIPTTHVSNFGKKKQLKVIRWFLILYLGNEEITKFLPQINEGIEKCRWFSPKDLERPLSNCPARIDYLIRFWLKVRKEIAIEFPA